MNGYIQMTPVPDHLDQDEEILDRMVSALDGKDQVELRKLFANQEKDAFRAWSGVDEESWRVMFLRGFPSLFICFFGPVEKEGVEPRPPIEEKLNNFLKCLSTDVVYGDTGCILDGVPFDGRARWKVSDKQAKKRGSRKIDLVESFIIVALIGLLAAIFLLALSWLN